LQNFWTYKIFAWFSLQY